LLALKQRALRLMAPRLQLLSPLHYQCYPGHPDHHCGHCQHSRFAHHFQHSRFAHYFQRSRFAKVPPQPHRSSAVPGVRGSRVWPTACARLMRVKRAALQVRAHARLHAHVHTNARKGSVMLGSRRARKPCMADCLRAFDEVAENSVTSACTRMLACPSTHKRTQRLCHAMPGVRGSRVWPTACARLMRVQRAALQVRAHARLHAQEHTNARKGSVMLCQACEGAVYGRLPARV